MQQNNWFKQLFHNRAVILFISLSIGVFIVLQLIYSFRITEIKLQGAHTVFGVESLRNKIGFMLHVDREAELLLSQNPSLKQIVLRYVFPRTIHVYALPNRATAFIKKDNYSYILGEDGRIISKTIEKPDLSEIQYLGNAMSQNNVGERIAGKEILFALNIISVFGGTKRVHIDISGNSMILCKIEDKTYIFGGKRNEQDQIKDALFMKRQLEKEGTEYRLLDVRFSKPIVSNNPYESTNIDLD